MEVKKQIEYGLLVCPESKSTLLIDPEKQLINTLSGHKQYSFLHGTTPVLLLDEIKMQAYATSSEGMNREYSEQVINKKSLLFLNTVRKWLSNDYRTKQSKIALNNLFQEIADNQLCLSIGGGPSRAHNKLTNVNIGPFPNVDVVADAHHLPYADNSVDLIHCEAVLEHLHTPFLAVKEMFRVLKKDSKVYVCTPFLQPYHGYPHHYQGFTLTGQTALFESAGFKVSEAGVCVGPIYTLMSMIDVFIINYVPSPFNKILKYCWSAVGMLIKPLDLIIGNKSNAHIMASTTYLIAEKTI